MKLLRIFLKLGYTTFNCSKKTISTFRIYEKLKGKFINSQEWVSRPLRISGLLASCFYMQEIYTSQILTSYCVARVNPITGKINSLNNAKKIRISRVHTGLGGYWKKFIYFTYSSYKIIWWAIFYFLWILVFIYNWNYQNFVTSYLNIISKNIDCNANNTSCIEIIIIVLTKSEKILLFFKL